MALSLLDFLLTTINSFVTNLISTHVSTTSTINYYNYDLLQLALYNELFTNTLTLNFISTIYSYVSVLFIFDVLIIFFIKCTLYYIILIISFSSITTLFFTSNSLQSIRQFYFEFEHNVGNGEDLLMIISLIISIILLNFLYIYFSSVDIYIYFIKSYLFILFALIPFKILLMFGSNFLNYINGITTKSNFASSLYTDLINLLVFFIRFALQGIRLVLISIFYFSIHEYVFTMPIDYLTNWITFCEIYKENFFSLIFKFIRWAFELLDSTVSICNQTASFFFVIFWLFSYINTFELKEMLFFDLKKYQYQLI